MKLSQVVFFLFSTFVPESLSIENKKENFTSLVDKSRNISTDLDKHPKGFLHQRRQISIPKAKKDKTAIRFWNRNKKGVNSSKLNSKNGARYRRSEQRIQKRHRRKYSGEMVKSVSTSMEMQEWREQLNVDRLILKQQALLELNRTSYLHGDEVGMNAARPWGVPCGDPQQHDWPWGSCMLPQACDPEYRIYRGDLFCGRSNFICCSVLLTHHDMYQGLDLSLVKTSSSDSDEKSKRDVDSGERKRDKKRRIKIREYKTHRRQKRLLKRTIRKIVRQIKKTLSRAYRNTTINHKRVMKQLRIKVKHLKEQFREQRKMALFRYELDVDGIKRKLYKQLVNLNAINAHYFVNESFRAFLERHNISLLHLRMTQLKYPNLARYVAGEGTLSEGLQQILDLAMLNESQVGLGHLKISRKVTIASVGTPNNAEQKSNTIQLAVATPKKAKSNQPAFNSTRPTGKRTRLLKEIKPIQLTVAPPVHDETEPINFINKFKKEGLRTLDLSADDGSASLVYTPLSKSKPQVKDKSQLNKTASEAVYLEDYVTEALESLRDEGSTVLNEVNPTIENYVAMEPKDVQDTRRSGQGIFAKRKEPKKLKRQDYLEYDVEFGLLYT